MAPEVKEVSAALVKELRELTGAGMMECKKALVETSGDLAKAVEELRKRGIAKGAKLASRIASEGAVGSYVHLGGKIGVLVEVNCETDFVGRSPEFQELVKVIAMHIAATAPRWIKREDVPVEVTNKEKEILAAAEDLQNKPAPVREKIVEGRLNKFFEEVCLLEQPFVKDPNSTVLDLITQKTTKLGEKIEIRRFIRYQLGEGLERRSADFAAEVAKQIEH